MVRTDFRPLDRKVPEKNEDTYSMLEFWYHLFDFISTSFLMSLYAKTMESNPLLMILYILQNLHVRKMLRVI